MFYGNDPDGKGYSTHAHLAEVVGMFGLPPLDLLKSGKRSHEFFDEDGMLILHLEEAFTLCMCKAYNLNRTLEK